MPLSVFFIVLAILSVCVILMFLLSVTLVFHGYYQEHFVLRLHIHIFGKKIKSLKLYPNIGRGSDPRWEKFPPRAKARTGFSKKKSGQGSDPRPMLKLLNKSKIAVFINCFLGLSDAASTAVGTGFLYSFFNTMATIVDNHVRLHKWQVEILPSFYKKCFIFNGICIARLSLGNIILGFLHYKKEKRK